MQDGDWTASSRHPPRNAIAGLAAVLNTDQLGILTTTDPWLAHQLLDQLSSWLHWNPIADHLAQLAEYIRDTTELPIKHRKWAAAILRRPYPVVPRMEQMYLTHKLRERDERRQFRCRHLHYLPVEVAAWICPSVFWEGYQHTPSVIKWAYATEVAYMADHILEHHEDPTAFYYITLARSWATELLCIK